MNIITVTKDKARLGGFYITTKRAGKAIAHKDDAFGVDAAAAKAMEKAFSCDGKYQIIGDAEVINAIKNGGVFGENK